jgi:hypothetical protein
VFMTRKTIKRLALALIAVFALGAASEAAAPRKVRHRPKHSTRVSSGTTSTLKKRPAAKKRPVVRKSTTARKAAAKRRPPTKPR